MKRIKQSILFLWLCLAVVATASAQTSFKFKVDTMRWSGDKCINIVFLGEGYTEPQLTTFAIDAAQHMNYFLKEDPYKRYAKYFNFVRIKTPSNVSGAGLTPDAQIDNFYRVTFGHAGVDRMPWPQDFSRVNRVLSTNFPNYDLVIIIVNSTKYGGAGASKYICYSKNPTAPRTLCHESGHGFGGLGDEYWNGGGYEAPNLTAENDSSKVKWKNWLGSDDIGMYHFVEDTTNTWVRPHPDCLMRGLNNPFCSVCKENLVERIHAIVNPILSTEPKIMSVNSMKEDSMLLRLNLLQPNPNTLKIRWVFEKDTIARDVDSVRIQTSGYPKGTYYCTAIVEDTSDLVRVNNHATVHVSSVTWKLYKRTTGIKTVAQPNRYVIGPTPFTSQLVVTRENAADETMNVQLLDLSGKMCAQAKGKNRCVVTAASLSPGIYVLRIYEGNHLAYSRKIVKK